MSFGTSLRRYYRGHTLATMSSDLPDQKRHYHFDHQGTTQCLTDQTGAVTDRFASNAWGVEVKRTGTSINRHWYIGASGYYVGARSEDYVRHRWTSSALAAWLSTEPLRLRPLYLYVHNRPTLLLDASGLLAESGTGWRRGRFVYWPGPWEPHSDINSDFRIRPLLQCLLIAPDCVAAVYAYLAFAKTRHLPLLQQHVENYIRATGQTLQIPPLYMRILVSDSVAHNIECTKAARSAAAYFERHVFKRCLERKSWQPFPLVSIWHRGRLSSDAVEVKWNEHLDLAMTLGHSQVWAQAAGNCECFLTDRKDHFYMKLYYGITDRNLWDGSGPDMSPIAGNPLICHECGWYKDFLVYGWLEHSFHWVRGASSTLRCPT